MGFLSSFFKKEDNRIGRIDELEESALNGNKKATLALAQDSISGICALKPKYSHGETMKWNKLAAEYGDSESQFNYALMLFKAISFEDGTMNITHKKALEEVLFWFKKAAEQNDDYQEHVDNIKELLQAFE